MEGGALSDPNFPAFSEKVVPYLNIMTKIEGRPYDDMLIDKGFGGFPTLAFMDVDGKVLAQPSGRSVEAFDETLGNLSAWMELKGRVAAGEEGLKYKLFVTEWDLGMLTWEDVKAKGDALGKLDDKQKAKVAGIRLDAEILALAKSMNTREGRDEAVRKAGGRFHEMMKAGHQPSERAQAAFWNGLMSFAELEQDVKLFAKCVDHFKEMYKDEPRAARYLENLDKKLAEMKGAGDATP